MLDGFDEVLHAPQSSPRELAESARGAEHAASVWVPRQMQTTSGNDPFASPPPFVSALRNPLHAQSPKNLRGAALVSVIGRAAGRRQAWNASENSGKSCVFIGNYKLIQAQRGYRIGRLLPAGEHVLKCHRLRIPRGKARRVYRLQIRRAGQFPAVLFEKREKLRGLRPGTAQTGGPVFDEEF